MQLSTEIWPDFVTSFVACLGAGVLWIIRDPRKQGLHDKLVGSLVVREDESLITLEELAENLK